jgi:uncharacterized protein YfaP (DUF2135 family)
MDHALFCTKCGARVTEIPAQQQPVVEQPVVQPIAQKKSKAPLIAGVVAAVCLVIAAGVGAGFFLYNNTSIFVAKDDRTGEETEESSKHSASLSNIGEALVEQDDGDTEETTEETTEEEEEAGVILLSTDTEEGKLQQEIFEMNDASYQEASINVYEENYETGKRDTSAIWDNTVFYTLEGYSSASGYLNKDQCQLIKKEMRNSETGNIMQYDIYLNPDTGVANKIVSIEYQSDGLEVTEYYYDKNAKVSFVFQYTADNYVSSYATPDKAGNRYLFNDDCLVTWRSITEKGTTNYVIGKKEAERMTKGKQFSEKSMKYYSNLSDKAKKKFDKKEIRMVNAAYNTYNTVMNSEGIAHIQGYAYDGNGTGIDEAVVELYTSDFSTEIYQAVTDSEGMYTIYVPNQEYDYNLCIRKDGMSAGEIYQIEMNSSQIGAYQDSVYLFDENYESADVQMTLGDALEYAGDGNGMKKLSGAEVLFRRGINNRTGEIVAQGTADKSGILTVALVPGVYTIEVNMTDYQTMYYTVIANPMISSNVYEFYATPTLDEGEYAIVLTWGATPSDLDSHLFTTSGSSSDHIWFGERTDDYGSYLDVDDTTSYGPETVTIQKFDANSYYKYCVVDYTNCSSENYKSTEMSESMACVKVYSSDGLLASYSVPTGQKGVVWEVFEIRNGQISPIQRYYSNVENKTWWHSDK